MILTDLWESFVLMKEQGPDTQIFFHWLQNASLVQVNVNGQIQELVLKKTSFPNSIKN